LSPVGVNVPPPLASSFGQIVLMQIKIFAAHTNAVVGNSEFPHLGYASNSMLLAHGFDILRSFIERRD
jgi:hypothetical protein